MSHSQGTREFAQFGGHHTQLLKGLNGRSCMRARNDSGVIWAEFSAVKKTRSQVEQLSMVSPELPGTRGFVDKLEKGLGRILHRRKPGPKRRTDN